MNMKPVLKKYSEMISRINWAYYYPYLLLFFGINPILSGQALEYALIEDQQLFLQDKNDKRCILSGAYDRFDAFRTCAEHFGEDMLLKWCKSGDALYFTGIPTVFDHPRNIKVLLAQIPLIHLDTHQIAIEKRIILDSLYTKYGDTILARAQAALQSLNSQRRIRLAPVHYLLQYHAMNYYIYDFQRIMNNSQVDIASSDNQNLLILHRTDKTVDIWQGHFQYKDSLIYSLVSAYQNDSLVKPVRFDPNKHQVQQDSERVGLIQDEGFFKGRLKLIQQNGQIFIINLHHGQIYHASEILRQVGILEKPQDGWTANCFDRALLVEDRDQHILLTSQPVRRYAQDMPFPVFKIVTKEDLEFYFRR